MLMAYVLPCFKEGAPSGCACRASDKWVIGTAVLAKFSSRQQEAGHGVLRVAACVVAGYVLGHKPSLCWGGGLLWEHKAGVTPFGRSSWMRPRNNSVSGYTGQLQ